MNDERLKQKCSGSLLSTICKRRSGKREGRKGKTAEGRGKQLLGSPKKSWGIRGSGPLANSYLCQPLKF